MFLKADLIMAAVMILIVVIGLLVARRMKKDVVGPLDPQRQRPIHVHIHGSKYGKPGRPGNTNVRVIRRLPDDPDAIEIMEQFREL